MPRSSCDTRNQILKQVPDLFERITQVSQVTIVTVSGFVIQLAEGLLLLDA
jgi:hypothetical protein